MSANVETMFYTRDPVWHGLGTRVAEALSSEEALEKSGLNWTVVQQSIYTASGQLIKNYKANLCNDLSTVFWTVFSLPIKVYNSYKSAAEIVSL